MSAKLNIPTNGYYHATYYNCRDCGEPLEYAFERLRGWCLKCLPDEPQLLVYFDEEGQRLITGVVKPAWYSPMGMDNINQHFACPKCGKMVYNHNKECLSCKKPKLPRSPKQTKKTKTTSTT